MEKASSHADTAHQEVVGSSYDGMPKGRVDTAHWWRYKNLRALNMWLFVPLLSIFSQGATLGIFNAAYPLGGIAGVFLISFVADRFGRRIGLFTGAALCCLGAALQGAAVNIAMSIVARVVIGAGSVVVAGRSTMTALFLTFYSIGSIMAGWCTFGTFRIDGTASWRIPSTLQAVSSVTQVLLVWWVPESPRWLVDKGRNQEARDMLVSYHGEGDASDPLVLFEYNEIITALAAEKEMVAGQNLAQDLAEFFKTPGNRKRSCTMVWAAICSQMSGNAFVSYYLSPIFTSVGLTSDLQQTLINATNQMLSWFSALYFATLPAKIGRRVMFLCSLVAMWVVVICITAGSAVFATNNDSKAAAYSVVVFLYLFSPAYNFGFNGNLGLYIPEILPYCLRTRGLAFFYFVQFSFMILFTFAIPVGLENIQWRLYIVFIAWIVVEFVGVWLTFPETEGPSLEDIAYIFDGPSARDTAVEKRLEDGPSPVIGKPLAE